MAVVPLKDVDTRKIGSAITAVASEKTKEAKDKASGKKKASPHESVQGRVTSWTLGQRGRFANDPDVLFLKMFLFISALAISTMQTTKKPALGANKRVNE